VHFIDQKESFVKKSVMLFVLLFAFSVQLLYAQDIKSLRREACPIDDVCDPEPTPTPTPSPTPTPTPTPNAGNIGPKYVVASVTYEPPGAASTAVYSNSTLFGSSLSVTESFGSQENVSLTLSHNTGGIFGFGSSMNSVV